MSNILQFPKRQKPLNELLEEQGKFEEALKDALQLACDRLDFFGDDKTIEEIKTILNPWKGD